MGKKKVAFMVLLLVMAGAYCLTSTAFSVAPGASFSLHGFISSLTGVSMALAEPVNGGGSGGDN